MLDAGQNSKQAPPSLKSALLDAQSDEQVLGLGLDTVTSSRVLHCVSGYYVIISSLQTENRPRELKELVQSQTSCMVEKQVGNR